MIRSKNGSNGKIVSDVNRKSDGNDRNQAKSGESQT